jgi:hypothetical protein
MLCPLAARAQQDRVSAPAANQKTITYPASDAAGRRQYVGGVKAGKAHGRGTLTWNCGSRFEGQFKNDKLTGHGTYTWPDGKTYTGMWKDGKANGKGVLKNGAKSDSSMKEYDGEWREGLMHGYGRELLVNCEEYSGQWTYNNRHGHGQFTWANGDRFEGEFRDHKMHGYGVLRFPNGRKVRIEFDNDLCYEALTGASVLWLCFVLLGFIMLLTTVPSDYASWRDGIVTLFDPSSWAITQLLRSPDHLAWPKVFETFIATIDVKRTSHFLRLALLLMTHGLLRDFFSAIIWNMACLNCHAGKSGERDLFTRADDETAWNRGIFLGCCVVCVGTCMTYVLVP